MPRCPDCGLLKDASEFPRNRSTKSGLAAYCKPCHNARTRASVARNGGARRYHLRRRFGIEPADVERMIEAQGGLCAVCRKNPPTQVDHDHETGLVRGILCDGCNGGLGHFRDDPNLIRRAIAYVRRHR